MEGVPSEVLDEPQRPQRSPSEPGAPGPESPAPTPAPTPAMPAEAALPAATPAVEGAPETGPAPMPAPLLERTHTLRDRIVEHLRASQADSISGIARHLALTGDAPVHRLTVAGYLQAMTEGGTLRALDRPPSKLYQLQNPEAHWSLHQRVHRILQEASLPEGERGRLAVAVLQRVLGRPVFQSELLHAGFPQTPPGLEKVVVGDGTRRIYRDLFGRRASPRIDVPPRDPLLALPPGDPLHASPLVDETLLRLLLRATAAEHLVAPRASHPQQAQLDLAGAP